MFLAAGAAAAQDEGDRGFLTGLIERNLSGAGREVRLEGFQGALSSRARIARMTIADSEGVWLTIEDAAIRWNRGALLRGRIEIGEMSAGEIDVARLPVVEPSPGLPEPAARPFRLPELPVSVRVENVAAARVTLGETILGEAVAVALQGGLVLQGGEGRVRAEVQRTDGTAGDLSLAADFVNASEALSIDLSLDEPQDGIAARLLNLPGRPAVALSVNGSGTLSDFAADIGLSSDGAPRLAGTFTLTEETAEATPGAEGAVPVSRFGLDVAGDVTPLFLPEYREFFGPDVRLALAGTRAGDGRTEIEALELSAASLELEGALTLAADGLPEAFALEGRIAAPDGSPVRLPTAGAPVLVQEAEIDIGFDATDGDRWTGAAVVLGLAAGENGAGRVTLDAGGLIARAPGGDRRVEASLSLAAEAIAAADPRVAEALGASAGLQTSIVWAEGAPVEFTDTVVETATARARLAGTLGPLAEGLPVALRGSANVGDLAAFSGLAARPVGGRVVLALNGSVTLLDGRFDLRAAGTGRDVTVNVPVADRLLAGSSRIILDARRDETGLTLRELDVVTGAARAEAAGRLASGQTDLTADVLLEDAGQVVPGLAGPGRLRAAVRETAAGTYDVTATANGPGAAELTFAGRVLDPAEGSVSAEGRLQGEIGRLAAYAGLAGRPLGGAVTLTVAGSVAPEADAFDVTLDAEGRGLSVGIPTVDRMLGGRATIATAAARSGGVTRISRLALRTGEVEADISGTLGRSDGRIEGQARLRNVGLFAPDFPGPLTVRGGASRSGGDTWTVDVNAEGPGATTARVSGQVSGAGGTANLAITGNAPLGLVNDAIAPRAVSGRADFNLRLNGAPRLDALSGTVGTTGARLVAPTYGVAVSGIAGTARIAGGSVAVDLGGNVEGGGRATVAGSVGITGGRQADLRVGLQAARLSDPDLFRTIVDGEVTLRGPLAGGARIGGALQLGQTELRVNPAGGGDIGTIPGLIHRNEPPDVRLTRLRAGLIEEAGGRGPGRPLAIDLTITAPSQVFVRGRGLDAELGGSLRLLGTTADVVPQGGFELIRGRLDILARRFALTEGSARLEGSLDPYLRLVATSEAADISVRIIVEGSASAPEITFESSPELPQDEVLARLFFGRGIDQLSPLQAARLASALATLAGGGGGGVIDQLRQNFGLDDLDLTTDAEGNAAVRAGRYVSENVYTEVTIGSEGTSDVSINLDLTPSVTVRGNVDSEGETGLGIFFERDY